MNPAETARQMSGGHGTAEGAVGLVDPTDPPIPCALCEDDAIVYFVVSPQAKRNFVCLAHAGTVAYAVATTAAASADAR